MNSNTATTAAFAAYLAEESEEMFEVEEWMIEADNFGTFINIEEETELPLELEEWMLNEKTFEVTAEKVPAYIKEKIIFELCREKILRFSGNAFFDINRCFEYLPKRFRHIDFRVILTIGEIFLCEGIYLRSCQ